MKTLIIFFSFLFSTLSVIATGLPKNVVLIIVDGIGINHIQAAMLSNCYPLNITKLNNLGFLKTGSADNFNTDTAAGATAIACGVKTSNGMLGMNSDSTAIPSILSIAKFNHLSTGIIVTGSVTSASPASFIAHQNNKNKQEDIAEDILNSDIDVLIGGGLRNFENRYDDRNLINELQKKGYNTATNLDQANQIKTGKLAAFVATDQLERYPLRGDFLCKSTEIALKLLDKNKKGFFLIIENTHVDQASHENNISAVINEIIDTDKAIGKIINYAEKHKNTLIIFVSNHETGGLTITDGDLKNNTFQTSFSSKYHTAILTPMFSLGPGSKNFTGIFENTDINPKIQKLLRLKALK